MIELKKDSMRGQMDNESQRFIEELERKYEGSMTYRTFATWFGSSDKVVREFGVFIFKINEIVYFEDFERVPSILGITLPSSKRATPYVKLEESFDPKKVVHISTVTRSYATDVVQQKREIVQSDKLPWYKSILSKLVTQLIFEDGKALFFELINPKEFIGAVKEAKGERI